MGPQGLQDGHEPLPVAGTVYSAGGPNTGCPAAPLNDAHYPVEAVCQCDQVIRSEHPFHGWYHTGRRPGDPR